MKINELYKYIEDNNIHLIYTDKLTSVYGLYLNIDNEDFIFIRNNLTKEEEYFTLNEEIAHYKVGVIPTKAFSNDYNDKLLRSKNEYKAFKWCVNELLPVNTLKSILRQNKYQYEVAEELNLPQDFVGKAFDLYTNNLKEIKLENN